MTSSVKLATEKVLYCNSAVSVLCIHFPILNSYALKKPG